MRRLEGHASGRSRGGLTTKIYILCETNWTPLRIHFSGGQSSDISYAQPLLDEVSNPSSQRGRPRKTVEMVACRQGPRRRSARPPLRSISMQPVIPSPSLAYPGCLIGQSIDNTTSSSACLAGLKENLRIETRFDGVAKSYAAMVSLACSMRCLGHLFLYRA